MKIDEFKKLDKKINGLTFNESYKSINKIMIFLSYFGHIASIFLAYFMLSKVLSGAITDNFIVVFISTVILLGGMEYLKREVFDKFSIQYLKVKAMTKEVLPLFFLSFLVVGMSFYATISGANEFSSKGEKIETEKKEVISTIKDDISKKADSIISIKSEEISIIKSKIDSKDKEQTDISSNPNRNQLKRISDLKAEKEVLRKDIEKVELEISQIKSERDKEIEEKSEDINKETSKLKDDNSKNTIMFVIISSIIELLILAGVFFNEYYKFRSYHEFRSKIEKDASFKKWELYDRILDVLYNDDTKINQKLPSSKSISDMCRVNGILILNKDLVEFLKLLSSINIIKTSGSAKYIAKPYDIAKEDLMRKFNIE